MTACKVAGRLRGAPVAVTGITVTAPNETLGVAAMRNPNLQ